MNGIEWIVTVVGITVVLTEAIRMYLTVCVMKRQRDEAYDEGRRSEQIDNAFDVQSVKFEGTEDKIKLIDEKNQLQAETIELKEKCKELEIRLKEARGEK